MIRWLWRLNRESWKGPTIAAAFVCVIGVAFNKPKLFENLLVVFSVMPFTTQQSRLSKKRCSVFQAALPIPAGDIFLSYLIPPIFAYWALLAAVLAISAVAHFDTFGPTVALVLGLGSVTTLMHVVWSCIRPQEFEPPKGQKWIAIVCALLAMVAFLGGVENFGAVPGFKFAAAICGPSAAILLWNTLRKFPASFETAPRKPVKPKSRESGFGRLLQLPESGWSVVLRSLYGAQFFFWLPFLCLTAALLGMDRIAAQAIETLLALFATWFTLIRIKRENPWLSSIPIRWQFIFAPVALIPLAALSIGMAVRIHSFAQPVRTSIIGLLTVEVASLLPGALIGVPRFAGRHKRLWLKARRYAIHGALLWAIAAVIGVGRVPIETWLDKVLPSNPVPFSAVALAIVGTAFCVAYMGFSRMEVRPGGANALAAARRAASGGRWG